MKKSCYKGLSVRCGKLDQWLTNDAEKKAAVVWGFLTQPMAK